MKRFIASAILLSTFSHAGQGSGGRVLNFFESVQTEKTLPDGCGNPYAEAIRFREFYDNVIAYMAAKRGSQSKGVVDLFAVSAVRDEISVLFPGYTEESPVDRLVMAQLCQYQKIAAQSLNLGDKPLLILASDTNLHDHLSLVAKKMYGDSKALLLEAVSDERKKQRDAAGLKMRFTEVLRAREESNRRVRDLVE
jgi:hypothetical protein